MTNSSLSFGDSYAVLNLDWMSVLINAIKNTSEGQALIANCSKWNDAVHQKSPRPLTVFSILSFNPGQPEVQAHSPFAKLIAPYGEFTNGSPEVQIDGHFKVDKEDLILQKTRWSATLGNALEQILKARDINTVIIVRDVDLPVRIILI
jgi:Isochorismatase family.